MQPLSSAGSPGRRFFWGPGWRGHLLAAVAGPLITLSLAPFDWWPLGIAALALLALLLDGLSPRQAAYRGWWFGAGLFGSGVSWVYVSIHIYGYAPAPLAAALTLVFCLGLALLTAGFAWSYARWIRELRGGRWLGFAAAWMLWEWLRSWLLTGFPWLYVGYGHLYSPLSGWAPVGGVFGIGLIAALTGAALARGRAPGLAARAVTITALWLGGWALGQIDWVQPSGEPLRVALVQANIPQSVKWDPARYQATLDTYSDLSAPLWQEVDLVVWPEAAITGFADQARPFLDVQAARAVMHQSSLITGVPWRERDAAGLAYYNSALALGNASGVYHKQRLVPFGEYVPLESWLRGLIRFFDLPMSNFRSGGADQSPLQAAGRRIGPLICYEVVYPGLVTDWLPATDVLLTISNDAWFGDSLGPLQHLQMAQLRALESGRPMIRATGNGVTALIDHRGVISDRLPQFEQSILTGQVQPMRGLTPFARAGLWLPVIAAGLILLAGWAPKRRH